MTLRPSRFNWAALFIGLTKSQKNGKSTLWTTVNTTYNLQLPSSRDRRVTLIKIDSWIGQSTENWRCKIALPESTLSTNISRELKLPGLILSRSIANSRMTFWVSHLLSWIGNTITNSTRLRFTTMKYLKCLWRIRTARNHMYSLIDNPVIGTTRSKESSNRKSS